MDLDANNEILTDLEEIKNQLRNVINPHISQFDIRVLNQNTTPYYEADLVYLHIQIMFADANQVDIFLRNYCNLHGFYATTMFVNHPLIDTENHMNVTPLDAATLWSDDPHMIRILYKWGADTSIPNANGHYMDDNDNNMNMLPYRNYLSRYVLMENIDPHNYPPIRGRRIYNQFYNILNELRYITGSLIPPQHWITPNRFLRANRINANNHQY